MNPQIQWNDVKGSSLHIVTPCPLCLYWPWLLQGPENWQTTEHNYRQCYEKTDCKNEKNSTISCPNAQQDDQYDEPNQTFADYSVSQGLEPVRITWDNTACDCYSIQERLNILGLLHWKQKMLLVTWCRSKGEWQPGIAPHRCNTGTGDGQTILTPKVQCSGFEQPSDYQQGQKSSITVIPWMCCLSASDGIPHFPKIPFVVELSEKVLLYSGNMLIAPNAPLGSWKQFHGWLDWSHSIEMLSKRFSKKVLHFFICMQPTF